MRHLRGSQWLNFPIVRNAAWYHDNVVLIGDAAHTAHFSIGSGTKLAMEDAIALARVAERAVRSLTSRVSPAALARPSAYQDERSTEALRLQNAARNSMEWFENVRRYIHLPPEQFAYSLLTRSQRVSHENLRLARSHVSRRAWSAGSPSRESGIGNRESDGEQPAAELRSRFPFPIPPMFTPYRCAG